MGTELDQTLSDDSPETIETMAGEARLSKYVGYRGMLDGGKTYGFMSTVPSHTDMFVIDIRCESQGVFDKYVDTFLKIILSIGD